MDAEPPYDLVVLRGRALTAAAAKSGAFTGRLWPYLTDVPQSVPGLTPAAAAELGMIASAARYVLCQTEELRCFLEGSIPAACGKCVLLPPILSEVPASRSATAAGSPLRLVYSGKFAPRWNTLEMTELPELLAAGGVTAELHMIGDKIHDDAGGYQQRMRAALDRPGVTWHGGHSGRTRCGSRPRATSGWLASPRPGREPGAVHEGARVRRLGLPVTLNRTPMHEGLLGADYPPFAAEPGRGGRRSSAAAAADPDLFRLAADRTAGPPSSSPGDRRPERLRGYLAGRSAGGCLAGPEDDAGRNSPGWAPAGRRGAPLGGGGRARP